MLMKPRLQTREQRSQSIAHAFSGLNSIARRSALHFSNRDLRIWTTNFVRTDTTSIPRELLFGLPAPQNV